MENERLRVKRKEKGLTQAQVAKQAHITLQGYQKIEYGTTIPKVISALLIAKALNSTVEELFKETIT